MRPRTERRRVALALAGLVILLAPACRDLYVTNPNEPDLERALATSSDVEALIRGSFYSYWLVTHSYKPDAQFSAAADAHSSAWGGWGNDAGREPRQAFNNDPSYSYHGTVESPWERSYAALTAVRDGLKAIEEGGVTISEDGQDVTGRAVAFGHLVQALSLSSLAVIFDQAFVVHEDTDLEEGVLPEPQTPEDTLGQRLRLVPYEEVWAAAEAKYAEAIATAQGTSFTIPKQWVGNGASWTDADFVAFTKAFRARFRIQVPRTPAEREAIDWGAVLADLSGGLPFTFGSYYDGTSAGWWDGRKVYTAGKPGWVRMDNRTLGPADVSGEWEHWLTQPPHDKYPFEILTPDSRITQPMQPRTAGKYFTYLGYSPFPLSRGVYHWGHYIDHRYNHLWEAGYVGFWEDFTDKEVDFIRAEAMYRTGDKVGAMVIVNEYRANGDLPPFTTEQNPDGPNMCVPQMPDGSCGDLWEALKYEKRIECFHTSFGMEFFDDRGWGDLVENTWLHLPVPGSELLLLLRDIYTFGGSGDETAAPGGGVTPNIINDFSPAGLRAKRQALERFQRQAGGRIDPGPRH